MKLKQSYRITTFVPPDSLQAVIDSINNAVVLSYGKYDHVLWHSSPGIEQYRPLKGANPTEGKVGVVTSVDSIKLEFSIPHDEKILERAINEGIKPRHPWEEPVILVSEIFETRKE